MSAGSKIIEAADLPSEEKVYLKKDWTGWRVIEPIKDPETGIFIWKNFLNRKGFMLLIYIIIIVSLGYMAFREQLYNYKMVLENPCDYCADCNYKNINQFSSGGDSVSGLNLIENLT